MLFSPEGWNLALILTLLTLILQMEDIVHGYLSVCYILTLTVCLFVCSGDHDVEGVVNGDRCQRCSSAAL